MQKRSRRNRDSHSYRRAGRLNFCESPRQSPETRRTNKAEPAQLSRSKGFKANALNLFHLYDLSGGKLISSLFVRAACAGYRTASSSARISLSAGSADRAFP